MKRASVVIVGAGVMGASVAYHLAARGWRDVLIVDRSDGPGRGSTGAATGGFRAQYGTAINVWLSLLAREKFSHFRDEIGVDPGYLPAGYLWLAQTPAELDILVAACLEKKREDRPQRIAGLVETFAALSSELRWTQREAEDWWAKVPPAEPA